MILYALRFIGTNTLATFSVSGNGDDIEFCNSTQVDLSQYDDAIWTTNTKTNAEYVVQTNTPWYNSTLEHPTNAYVGKLEVVEFHLKSS